MDNAVLKKILIVEDESILNDSYKKKFGTNYNLVFAVNGDEAISKAMSEKPDLIVLDLILPGGMNGFDVLREFKRNEDLKNIPVLVATNLGDEEKVVMELGAVDCVVKADTGLAELEEKIKKYLVS